MLVLFTVLGIVFVCFAGVILVGAPYLPILKPQMDSIFDLADIKSGQTLIDLGCGDGRVLIEAAKRGILAVGYELNPLLALLSWVRTIPYRKKVRVIWGNYWLKPWPQADFIFAFLLERYMPKLEKRLNKLDPQPIGLISFGFKLPNKKSAKHVGGVYLYLYQ